jgi:hypothetical protein
MTLPTLLVWNDLERVDVAGASHVENCEIVPDEQPSRWTLVAEERCSPM